MTTDETARDGESAAMDAAEQAVGVVMYCRTWCGDCMRARAWLEQHGIPYVEIDVDEDDDARTRAASHNSGSLHTPTFEIADDVCVDFRPERLRELLGL